MAYSQRIEFFLHEKWMEEDGDGLNLTIITPRRQLCQERMGEYLKDRARDGVDSMGKPLYWQDDLEEAFEACCPPLDEEKEPD